MRIAGLFFVLLLRFVNGWAQEVQKDSVQNSQTEKVDLLNDSTKNGKKNVVTIETYAKRFDPRKALFYSAVLPGAGQAYNKKYWKIPLVYGGLFGLLYAVKYYDGLQFKYKNQLFDIINYPDQPLYPGVITNVEVEKQLRAAIDNYRRQRDYFMILTGFFYILQMVDAHVDAHLKEFDLNPKMQVRIEPQFSPMQGIGMGITLRF
jgi:hypothetical protein